MASPSCLNHRLSLLAKRSIKFLNNVKELGMMKLGEINWWLLRSASPTSKYELEECAYNWNIEVKSLSIT